MFLLNLLCILCTTLFNASNIKSNVINNDVIFEKQEIAPKKAFTNDDYICRVNNQSVYRYASMDYTLKDFGTSGGIQNGLIADVNISTGQYSSTLSPLLVYDPSSINGVSLYANGYPFNDDNVRMLAANYQYYSYPYGVIVRFYAPISTQVKNIEIICKDYSNVSNIAYGVGDFLDNPPGINLEYNPIFLFSSNSGVSSSSTYTNTSLSRGWAYCTFWLFVICFDSNAFLNIEVNYLSSFDDTFRAGYDNGYISGYDTGYGNGFQIGYSTGYDDAAALDDTALTIFTGILEVGMLPVNVFLAIFNFEVFGINIAGVVSGLLTISVVIIILRFLLGGKSKDD